jgi:hypothetical protein
MLPFSFPFGDLIVERACLSGGAGRRGALEAGLARVQATDLVTADELLLVPHLKSKVVLEMAHTPSLFGARLTDQLRHVRNAALVDPMSAPSAKVALHFTSRAAFAAWVIAIRLRGQAGAVANSFGLISIFENFSTWQRRELLHDARLLVPVSTLLQQNGLAADWVASIDDSDAALALAGLNHSYGVPNLIVQNAAPESAANAMALYATRAVRSRGIPQDGEPTLPVAVNLHGSTAMHHQIISATQSIMHLPVMLRKMLQRQATETPRFADLAGPQRHLLGVLLCLARQPNAGPLLYAQQIITAMNPVNDMGAAGPVSGEPVHTLLAQNDAAKSSGAATQREKHQKIHSARAAESAKAKPFKSQQLNEGQQNPSGPAPPATTLRSNIEIADFAVPTPIQSFDSSFGGLLFLMNALLAMELYPDFTRPLDDRLQPSPFWLLDQLGTCVFGTRYRIDPLHDFLSHTGLAGALPDVWEVRDSWLERLPSAHFASCLMSKRLTLWDDRGFALFDGPLWAAATVAKTARAFRFAGQYSGQMDAAKVRKMPRSRTVRWVTHLAKFLSFRLKMAESRLAFSALRIPARVEIRLDRVDCHFSLGVLPLALRMAGLDRDPGWLPAEGRALAFHFFEGPTR